MPARLLQALGCSLVIAALAAPGSAVVIDTGDGTGNVTAPANDFGFDHLGVASANNLSVVYLGDRWVLTANHVGEQDVTLLGVLYTPEPGSSVRLEGPDPTIKADLRVYRLDQPPPLPSLVLSASPVSVSDEVHCVGHGWNREANPTEWDLSWNENPLPPLVAYRGYERDVGLSVRWGRNEVDDAGFDQELEDGNMNVVSVTRAFSTVFDETGGSVDEFQAVPGDSGGGCFLERNGTWELVGLLFARSLFPDQTQSKAVFGNESLVADVSYYRDQIETIMMPEFEALPAPWVAAGGAWLVASLRRRVR